MQLGQYAMREVINTQFFTFTGSTPLIYFDFPNSVTWDMSADISYATGGIGGPRRASFAGNKNGTLTIESQIFTLGSLAIMTGSEVLKQQANIFEVQNAIVKDSSGDLVVTLEKTPVAGNLALFKYVNGVIADRAYVSSISDKDITLSPGVVVAGDEVQVFYQWQTTNDSYTIQIDSDKFPPYLKVIGDAFFTDTASGLVVDGQFIFHKAKSQPTFSVSGANSGDPSSISMALDLFNAPQDDGRQAMVDLVLYDE